MKVNEGLKTNRLLWLHITMSFEFGADDIHGLNPCAAKPGCVNKAYWMLAFEVVW